MATNLNQKHKIIMKKILSLLAVFGLFASAQLFAQEAPAKKEGKCDEKTCDKAGTCDKEKGGTCDKENGKKGKKHGKKGDKGACTEGTCDKDKAPAAK